MLGCGLIHQGVLRNALGEEEASRCTGWAFGLGLERLAMVLFSIPDIRLFWSSDPRFLSQFHRNQSQMTKFTPFSKYPLCYKDVSFWLPSSSVASSSSSSTVKTVSNGAAEASSFVPPFHMNDVFEVIRGEAGDLVEKVTLFDTFTNKQGRVSQAYRIDYRHLERSLTNEEVDRIQAQVRQALVDQLHVVLR